MPNFSHVVIECKRRAKSRRWTTGEPWMNGTSGFLLMGRRLKRNELGTPNCYGMYGN